MDATSKIPATRYVIITPARDEAQHIEWTIKSVAQQIVLPAQWIIVDDGSTDRTAEIVLKHLPALPFITLLRLDGIARRNFGSKVAAFNAGLKLLEGTQYTFIGNLDADISFGPDYYANILAEFHENANLGLAGGIVFTKFGDVFDTDDRTLDSVGGAVQLFRRECFEEIGGYLALPRGGIDAAAEIMARMRGWTVRKFPKNKVWEYRRTGSADGGSLFSMFKLGVRFHTLGYSTSFFILRSIYKAKSRPYVLGSAAMLLGFLFARVRGYPFSLTPEAVSYLRSEQAKKLRERVSGVVRRATSGRAGSLSSPFPSVLTDEAPDHLNWGRPSNLTTMIPSQHWFTFVFHLPRIVRQIENWPSYILNYVLRRERPAEYRLRNGSRLIDATGTLAGTIAVIFVRREYGPLKDCRTIVDVGSNMGAFAVYAASRCPTARVYCFEPEERNFGFLKRNIAANSLDGRVCAYQRAVASCRGQRNLAVSESPLHSLITEDKGSRCQKVDCVSLKDIIRDQALEKIDLLKVNCEGAEYEIFTDLVRADFERLPDIRLEYHNLDSLKRNGSSLARFLESQGYRIKRFSAYRGVSGFIWALR